MPIIDSPIYQRPSLLFNRHLETIIPGLFRRVNSIPDYQRERIDCPDDDFIDIDWLKSGAKKLIILSHGLEGDSSRPYMRGMARAFYLRNWDVLAWNYRGCSGEMNLKKTFYHSGASYDLDVVVKHALNLGYEEICLIGFSLGGNMTLKYLGEKGSDIHPNIKSSVVFSVPLDLAGCSYEINLPHNILYSKRFLKSLKKKVRTKNKLMNGVFEVQKLDSIDSVYDFDDQFTAPVHGFNGADHYYEVCSSRNFVKNIIVRTLVINAENDPFLSESCKDESIFKNSERVHFEKPAHGGHVGFSAYNKDKLFWSEQRALDFVEEEI